MGLEDQIDYVTVRHARTIASKRGEKPIAWEDFKKKLARALPNLKPPRSRFKLPQTEKGTQMAYTAEYPQIFDLVRAALRFIDAFFRSAAHSSVARRLMPKFIRSSPYVGLQPSTRVFLADYLPPPYK